MIIVEESSNGPNDWATVSANWKLLQIYGGNPVLGNGVSNEGKFIFFAYMLSSLLDMYPAHANNY